MTTKVTFKSIQDQYYCGSVIKVALIYKDGVYTGIQLRKNLELGCYYLVKKVDNVSFTTYQEVEQTFTRDKKEVVERINKLVA